MDKTLITPKLSIIIPVYNVENYIAKCLSSVIQQDAKEEDFEVLFVIDGSKDNSENIIYDFVSDNSKTNISVLKKENGGLSSARNYGIVHAKGNYLWFVDSDDWIEPDSVHHILSIINEYHPDVIAQTHYFQENNKSRHIIRYNKEGLIPGPIFCGKDHSTAAQFYIIRKEFWHSHEFKFREGMLHEDGELTPRLLYTANSIYVSTKPIYHILVRQGSITHTINPQRCYDYMIVLDTLLKFYNEHVNSQYKCLFAHLMSDHVLGIMNLTLQVDSKTQHDVNTYLKNNKSFTSILFKSQKRSLYLFAILLRLFPNNPLKIYQIIKSIKK